MEPVFLQLASYIGFWYSASFWLFERTAWSSRPSCPAYLVHHLASERLILFSLLPDGSNGHESEPKAPVRLACLLDSTARSPPPSLLHRKQHLLRQLFSPLGSLSLCSSGCPGTGYLKTRTHTDPLASASQVLDLKVGATMLSMLRLLGAAGSADGVKVVPP